MVANCSYQTIECRDKWRFFSSCSFCGQRDTHCAWSKNWSDMLQSLKTCYESDISHTVIRLRFIDRLPDVLVCGIDDSGFPLNLQNLEKWQYTWKTWNFVNFTFKNPGTIVWNLENWVGFLYSNFGILSWGWNNAKPSKLLK